MSRNTIGLNHHISELKNFSNSEGIVILFFSFLDFFTEAISWAFKVANRFLTLEEIEIIFKIGKWYAFKMLNILVKGNVVTFEIFLFENNLSFGQLFRYKISNDSCANSRDESESEKNW